MIIKRISHKITKTMNSVYPRTDEECIKIEYMMEVLLSRYIILFAVFGLCAIIGGTRETWGCGAAFLILRSFAGGFHMKTVKGCIIVSTLILLFGGFVVRYTVITQGVYFLMILVSLVLLYLYSPQVSSDELLTEKYRKIRKRESLIIVCIIGIMLFISHDSIGRSMAIGAFLETLTVLPCFNS